MFESPNASKRNPLPLIALLVASVISLVGNVFAMIAIPWFVLQTTGSAVQTGFASFSMVLGSVVAAFFGGALVDRLGFKRTSILADIASGVAMGLIPLLYATLGLQFWQLLLLIFVGNLLDAPGSTARDALIPELAGMAGLSLERASAMIQAVERGARLIGAPLAGVLIGVVGTQNVLWLDAASFGISAVMVGFAVPLLQVAAPEQPPFLAGLKQGIEFIRRDALILSIVGIVMVTNFLDAPLGGVIFPLYAKTFYGSALDLGLILAASGGGAVVGALLFAAYGKRFARRSLFLGGFLLTTVRFWVMLFVPSLPVLLATQFIVGLGAGPLNPIIGTVEFERIPVHMRGRVFGTITAGAYIAMPLGILLAGSGLEVLDIRAVLAILGTVYVATILAASLIPAMRDMGDPRAVNAAAATAE